MERKKALLISGSANRALAEKVSAAAGIAMCPVDIQRFADGEIFVQIKQSVRGMHVFVVQPTCPPVNDNLMELLVMIDALNRASAASVTAVTPYYGYARQDRKVSPRTPISAKLVANLLIAAGVDRIVSLDLHAGQIQGFFDIPFDNLYGLEVLCDHIRPRVADEKVVIVSPDAGGVRRARAFAKNLNASLAIIDKRRPVANEVDIMHIIGDVEGATCIMVDDMVDTAGTLTSGAKAVKEAGANKVMAAITHGVLSGPAIDRLEKSVLHTLFITDTIPLAEEKRKRARIEVVSCGDLLGEAIRRIHLGESVSSLFSDDDA